MEYDFEEEGSKEPLRIAQNAQFTSWLLESVIMELLPLKIGEYLEEVAECDGDSSQKNALREEYRKDLSNDIAMFVDAGRIAYSVLRIPVYTPPIIREDEDEHEDGEDVDDDF